MPSPQRRAKDRLDVLDPIDQLEMVIGGWSERNAELWRRHGAQLMRDHDMADGFEHLGAMYGLPPNWTAQDERERIARRAEIEAGWRCRIWQHEETQPIAEEQ